MLSLNTSRMAPDVVALLFSRGSDLPPLRWSETTNRAAKKNLDGCDDATLLGQALQNEAMAASVRSLLYLWNGWIGECAMHAQMVPQAERCYLLGLCQRHQGHSDAAKKLLQPVAQHVIHEPLSRLAIDSKPTDPYVKRFADVLEMSGMWDPFAFIDLCDMAACGRVTLPGIEHVRKLQCQEFSLLFAHCYEGATGDNILELKRQDGAAVQRRAPRPAIKRASRAAPPSPRRPEDATRTVPRLGASTTAVATPKGPPVKVLCPKCGKVGYFPACERGRAVRCPTCNAAMLIPRT